MAIDEVADLVDEYQHDQHGDDNGGNHHFNLLNHAHGRDDGIEREHNIEQHDLNNDAAKRRNHLLGHLAIFTLQLLVNFKGTFAQQEQTSQNENQILARDRQLDGKHRTLPEWPVESDHPGQAAQENDTRDQGQREAEPARSLLLFDRQFAAENRDEDDIVNAENNLEHRQRQ